ncbi:MAG: tRNA preQ1(34) S-adenosylmethionine ribosyltransferase-isomerase QueA [bacterium]
MLMREPPSGCRLDDYEYPFDESLIAQRPVRSRGQSRLLVLNRATGETVHTEFSRLSSFLPDSTLICLNDTKVIAARLHGHKEHTGGKIELLLVREIRGKVWEVMAKGKLKKGTTVKGSGFNAIITRVLADGFYEVGFTAQGDFNKIVEQGGDLPLPPYIKRKNGASGEDLIRYQTVYARSSGAVAAPTAGLHFTDDFMGRLKEKGHSLCFLTLHVGPGTFLPVRVEDIREHKLHSESFHVSGEILKKLRDSKDRPVMAVGTTSARTLETVFGNRKLLDHDRNLSGETTLFIYPGYRFKAVNLMLTNFHLPRSTLLMMVCAFGGYEAVMEAYRQAVSLKYRFYSYGDAMLII